MVYDLMRGLDAKKGEFEFNTLYFSSGDMSPEVELAVKDGWAFELETPMSHGKFQSLKWGTQYTFYKKGNELLMGLQGIVEDHLYQNRNDYSLTLVVDYQIAPKISFVGIGGIRSATMNEKIDHNVTILNLSLFYSLSDHFFFGVENNKKLYFVDKEVHVTTIPQISWRLSKRLRLQAGVGFSWNENTKKEGFLRGIIEF